MLPFYQKLIIVMSSLACVASVFPLTAQSLNNERYSIEPTQAGSVVVKTRDAGEWTFRADFTVIVTEKDPKPALRPSGNPNVSFNVISWQSSALERKDQLQKTRPTETQSGDGFDDRILAGETSQRTADLFAVGPIVEARAVRAERMNQAIRFSYPEFEKFDLTAEIRLPAGEAEPLMEFTLTPKIRAWYSVGYAGAPAHDLSQLESIWQPFLWQEKRFPEMSFLTSAFQCPLPATLIQKEGVTIGVLADADEFPFDPLPSIENSRFGVALRNPDEKAQPMLFAPVPGGVESHRKPNQAFSFKLRLFVSRCDIPTAFERLARRHYGFHDYRRNEISTLNETLDNIVDYGMSRYSWFVDELKGCAYSTDVPGAVKNVSSLNPLNLAMLRDDELIFRKRAQPILEYMVSREKFLFSLDPKQKIQSPSRALRGPCAPISELAALYGISNNASPNFLRKAEKLLGHNRVLNLNDVNEGDHWTNHLALWEVTDEARYLEEAKKGADAHIAARIDQPATDFSDGHFFFWTGFTPKWIDLFRMFEATGEKRYLEASHQGARRYAMFAWMCPRIPDADVTVNPSGKAPHYWYLKSKGHRQMSAPEERVPAWRLSEIGLTPESCGTMSGHRAIFMANYAPWMLRLSAHTNDRFLHDLARSAIVGRYRNFPGYHINTARTTIYENEDYPLRDHRELSVNSFHYNHIWPHASILLDFMVSDAFSKSNGEIDFPSRFIEGYAYLQSKFYGDRPGTFYGRGDAILWMPRALVRTESVEINYLAARGSDRIYLAFMNQSNKEIVTEVELNRNVIPEINRRIFHVNSFAGHSSEEMRSGRFTVRVPPTGMTAVEIMGLKVTPKFQDRLMDTRPEHAWREEYQELPWGGARAMIHNFGPKNTSAYIYLQSDDSDFKEVSLTYLLDDEEKTVTDSKFPYEFSVQLDQNTKEFRFELHGVSETGERTRSGPVRLVK